MGNNLDLNELGAALKNAANFDNAEKNQVYDHRPEKSPELLQLLHQRRENRDRHQRQYLSKLIQKKTRQEQRKWRTIWAEHLLGRMRNTKHLQRINSDPVKSHGCPIEPDDFADFLGSLFSSSTPSITNIKIHYSYQFQISGLWS